MTHTAQGIAGQGLLVLLLAALAAVTAADPAAGVGIAAAAAVLAFVAVRGVLWWDVLVATLGGAMILSFGFANLGIPSRIPIPLAEIVLVVLLARVALTLPTGLRPRLPFAAAVAFSGLAAVRLFFDYPIWGKDAVRDVTLALELGFLFVGFWALRTYGWERFARALSLIFVLLLVHFTLYPWREVFAEAGPTVGLQRPVELLGEYSTPAAISGFFFFLLVRPFGRLSYVLAAAFLPPLAMLQMRGAYITVPLVAALVVLSLPRQRARLTGRLAIVAALGALGIALLFAAQPLGRLGPVTPEAVGTHLGTLTGGEGPGAGSFATRAEWFGDVVDRIGSENAWVLGLGLGPDLASGFRSPEGMLLRKPHNDYLEVVARLGIVGLALFVLAVFGALGAVWRAARRADGPAAPLLRWIVASSLTYLVIAATQPILAYPSGTMPLFVGLGAGLALAASRSSAFAPRSGSRAVIESDPSVAAALPIGERHAARSPSIGHERRLGVAPLPGSSGRGRQPAAARAVTETQRLVRSARVNGIRIDVLDHELFVLEIEALLGDGRSHVVNFIPAHPTVLARGDLRLRGILNSGGLNVADGMSVVWTLRALGVTAERIAGADAVELLCAWGVERGVRHFFLGSTPPVLEGLTAGLRARHPGVEIAGVQSPPFRELTAAEVRETCEDIRSVGTDLLWIGLSTPKQHVLAYRLHELSAAPVILCVGAAFDFCAGTKPRAPEWMQNVGLEWAHRLGREPVRLWRRYLVGNPQFVLGVLSDHVRAIRRNRESRRP